MSLKGLGPGTGLEKLSTQLSDHILYKSPGSRYRSLGATRRARHRHRNTCGKRFADNFLPQEASLTPDAHGNPDTPTRLRIKFSDILHLQFLEVAGRRPSPPPPGPAFPYTAEQCRSPWSILQADVASIQALWGCCKWWMDGWQVPLQAEYDAESVTDYFVRRPHLLAFRMLQVSLYLSSAWALVLLDTLAIRSAEADGVPSDSPSISAIRRRSARRLKRVLLQLGPTFVKLAQSISTRPDVVGPDTAAVLAELQDRLPPFPTPEALRVIEAELNVPSASLAFSSLGPEPVAAASLGQVYKGTTVDGAEVAVKVQRPGVLLTVARDICILRLLLRLLRHVARINSDLGLLADELGRGLFGELDYRQEAANAEEFAAAHAHMSEVVVPGVHHRLTSARVLTMDWVHGERTSDLLALAQLKSKKRAGGGDHAWAVGGADSESESDWEELGLWGALFGGRRKEGSRERLPAMSAEEMDAACELARAKLLTMVGIGVECSLEQLLGSGVLHADPHPGNLLLTHDGRLAYLDFGLLTRMQAQHQAAMLAAIAHLVNGEWGRLTEDLGNMDVLKPTTDRKAVTMALEEAFSSSVSPSQSEVPGDSLKFGQISSSLWKMALRFRFRLPPYYTLVLRSLASLEGIAVAVDPNFRVFACAYPYVVRRLLTDRTPSSQQVLRNLVLTPDGRLRWERFASFATSSSLATREDAISLAAPSLREKAARDASTGGAGFSGPTDFPAGEAQPVGGVQPVRASGGSRALALLDLLLSQEASSTRRMLLDSDVQYLAEAFVSSASRPARARLAQSLSEALYSPGSLSARLHSLFSSSSPNGVERPQPSADSAPLWDTGIAMVRPDRLLPGSAEDRAWLASDGGDKTQQPTVHSREQEAGIGAPGEEQQQPLPGEASTSPSGSFGAASDGGREGERGSSAQRRGQARRRTGETRETRWPVAKQDVRLKRLWVLMQTAFVRMGGGPLLKVKVVLMGLCVALAALLLALRNLVVDSAWQVWKILSGENPFADPKVA